MGYYNVGAQYKIIGRVLKGTSVISYMIEDSVKNTKYTLEKSIVEQLVLNKQVYNCNAQVYGDIVNLKGINCKISKLPKYNEDGTLADDIPKRKVKAPTDLRIVGKVTDGRLITDYIVSAIKSPEVKMQVPKDVVLQLALEGRFENAKVQHNGGELMLRGVGGSNLNQLTTYSVG